MRFQKHSFLLVLPKFAPLTRLSHKFQTRCEARQNKIRAGRVLAHATKRIAVITPHRALVVLRFLLNREVRALRISLKCTSF